MCWDNLKRKKNSKINNPILTTSEIYSYKDEYIGCQSPCTYKSGRCYQDQQTQNFVCRTVEDVFDGICSKKDFHSTLVAENYSTEASYFNFSLSYDFRDNFLNNYTAGQEYIEMYYELSEIVLQHVSLALIIKTANILGDCNIIMEKLLNPATYSNDIAITITQKNQLLDLINDYKLLSNDIDYQTKLTRIENDLNTFAGMTVSNLISNF